MFNVLLPDYEHAIHDLDDFNNVLYVYRTHSYFKSKNIGLKYLFEKHQLTFYDLSIYNPLIQNLTRKIANLLKPYKLSGDIIPYNAKTYQVINRK